MAEVQIDMNSVNPVVASDEKMMAYLKSLMDKGIFGIRREANAVQIPYTLDVTNMGSHQKLVSAIFEKVHNVKPFIQLEEEPNAEQPAEPPVTPSAPAPAPTSAPPAAPAQTSPPDVPPQVPQAAPSSAPKPAAAAAPAPTPAEAPAPSPEKGKKTQTVATRRGSKPKPNGKANTMKSVAYDETDDTPTEPPPAKAPAIPPPAAQPAKAVEEPKAVPTAVSLNPKVMARLEDITTNIQELSNRLAMIEEMFFAMRPVLSALLPTVQTGFHRIGKEMGPHVAQDLVKRFNKVEQSVAEATESAEAVAKAEPQTEAQEPT